MTPTATNKYVAYINPAIWGLVAFWAFVESFLGGMLHALQVPLRGIVIAGAAVACLITVAAVAGGHLAKPNRSFSAELIKATLVVMAVKLLLSPQAPPTAYVAMLFQGGLAYLLFGCIPSFRLAALLFSVLALLETALQKVLVLYLFFGADFWVTVSTWINELQLQFGFLPFSLRGIVITYLLLYFLAGVGIGYWFGFWPQRVQEKKTTLLVDYQASQKIITPVSNARSSSRIQFWLFALFIALVLGLFVLPYSLLLTTLLRLMVIGLAVYLATPLLLRLLKRALSSTIQPHVIVKLVDTMEEQKTIFQFCWQYFTSRRLVPRLLLAFEAALIVSATLVPSTQSSNQT
jgi:hypothetical protein